MEQTKTNYDEYLTRRARNRKIAMAVVSIVAALLAAAVIVLSFIKINNRPQFIKNADVVEIINPDNSNDRYRRDKGNTEYNEFYTAYNNCFEMSVLSSIFSNNFGDYSITELSNGKPVSYNGPTDIVEIGDANYYVKFSYNEPQSITLKSGKFYQSGWTGKTGNANAENSISFKTVLFALNGDNEVKDLNFYVIVDGILGKDNQGKEQQNILTITIKANTYSLYQSLGLE